MEVKRLRMLRIREILDKIGYNRKRRVERSSNGEREIQSYARTLFSRLRRFKGIDHKPIYAIDKNASGPDRFLIDEVSGQFILMSRGVKVDNPTKEAQNLYLSWIKEKYKRKVIGEDPKISQFIRGIGVEV